jgi:hypothetical protein
MMHQDADLKPDYLVREWTGEERRGIDGITLKLMAEVRSTIERHEKMEEGKFADIKQDIEEHRAESNQRHAELTSRFDQMQSSSLHLLQANNTTVTEIHKMFKAAFPEGGPDAHRRAHESWIEKDKADREFWLKTKQHVVQWGIIVALAWLGVAAWASFLKGPVQ